MDFEGAMQSLLDGNLVQKDGEEYVFTQEGYDYFYKRTGPPGRGRLRPSPPDRFAL